MSQGGRQGQSCRSLGHGLPKGQGHRKGLKWLSPEGQPGEDIGVRKGLHSEGLGSLGLADGDLAGRSLEERIKSSEAGGLNLHFSWGQMP